MRTAVVRFADYRLYEQKRVEASNAMMGLLAGAQLASHLLQLTEGSERLLPEVFPRVAHIGRFNLTTEEARSILNAADTHLGAMSVPYSLALHEDYLKTCLDLLARGGCCTTAQAERAKARLALQHRGIEAATGGAFQLDGLAQIDTLRLMRNCMIHDGGRASAALVSTVQSWTTTTESAWRKLAHSTLRHLQVGDPVRFGHAELILSLAVTKSLARQANVLLQSALPRSLWADLVLADLRETDPGFAGDGRQLLRKLRGMARFNYGPIKLEEADLSAAITRE
ncbi:hypothetical protein GCM10009745_64040 [Kribbella yunnanensis]|uniref:Uncharacterized protein n=1 Tax=Kribbella yunnanensis TaxID=190194 RepID=A0ABN2ILE3_9ACTN